MAVTYQDIGSSTAGTASVNVSWPTHVTNDIGILVLESVSATWTTPSGWTLVDTSAVLSSELNIYYKRATSSAEPAVATGFPAGADHVVARIFTFRGCVTTGSPVLTTATSTKITSSASWSAPSITTTTASEFVIYGVSRDNDSSSISTFSAPTNANLASPTEIVESGTATGNGGGFVLGYGVKTTAGATGTTTGTLLISSSNASITFSLQSAPTSFNLTADTGTYSFTGNAATLARAVVLASSSGNFIETGNAASLNRGFNLASSAGVFNEDGNNAALVVARLVTGSTGVFSFTGNAATFTKTTASKTLLADIGAFISTGNDAGFNFSRKLTSSTGAYSATGNAAGLQATRKATAAAGAFTLTGNATTFGLARKVGASSGNFALVGNNATLGNTYAIQCSPNAFALTGTDARVFKTKRRLINF